MASFKEKNEGPDATTMEGMVWNANLLLEQALSPGTNGLPKALFEKAAGLVLLSTVEGGFVFGGCVGTGILLARNVKDGTWSLPCACGTTGVTWGLLAGGVVKDVVVFIFDRGTVETMAASGLKMSVQAELAVGPLGRSLQLNASFTDHGIGNTLSVAYSQGFFVGVSIKGAIVSPRHQVNEDFYGFPCKASDIIFNKNHFDEKMQSLSKGTELILDELYAKLQYIIEGSTLEDVAEGGGENDEGDSKLLAAIRHRSDEIARKSSMEDCRRST